MRGGPLTARAYWQRRLGFALAVAVGGGLAALFLAEVRALQAQAERYAFERNLATLRHAVHIESTRILAREGSAGLRRRVGADALQWLDWNPQADSAAVPRTDWVYDPQSGRICYRGARRPAMPSCWRVEVDEVVDAAVGDGARTPVALRLQAVP